MSEKLPPILAAEDEESDRMILELAFERAQSTHPLVIVPDGRDAVDYLSGKGRYADRSVHPLPALLLLDLKMPRVDGFEVLTWLTTRPELRKIPAVVLSSSSDDSDVKKARQLGARDYFVKPHTLDDLVVVLRQLQGNWLNGRRTSAAEAY